MSLWATTEIKEAWVCSLLHITNCYAIQNLEYETVSDKKSGKEQSRFTVKQRPVLGQNDDYFMQILLNFLGKLWGEWGTIWEPESIIWVTRITRVSVHLNATRGL